ncbi:MAG: pentapeptide repeat-containing protein [Rhodomicrobiaceae bacterium]
MSAVSSDARLGLQAGAGSARHLLEAVNRASEAAGSAWLVHLALAAYFIVALAGVSHRDLLLNSPIDLPLLGISVALDRFFLFAPPLFILIHIGMMLQHVVLTRKVYAFLDVVEREERRMKTASGAAQVHPLRYELSSNFFTQFLAGPPQSGILTFMQQVIVWVTLVLLAAVVLLYFQIAFLPFHDINLTWAHRIYVLIDLALVGIIGTFLPSPLFGFWPSFVYGWRTYPAFMTITTGFFGCLGLFSFAVATVPGEWLDRTLATIGPAQTVRAPSGEPADSQRVFLPTAYMFEGAVDPATGRSASLFQRNLVVMDQDLVNDRQIGPGDISFSLRYRDLRYARLDRSDLKQVDLVGADLTGASLKGTQLDAADPSAQDSRPEAPNRLR